MSPPATNARSGSLSHRRATHRDLLRRMRAQSILSAIAVQCGSGWRQLRRAPRARAGVQCHAPAAESRHSRIRSAEVERLLQTGARAYCLFASQTDRSSPAPEREIVWENETASLWQIAQRAPATARLPPDA